MNPIPERGGWSSVAKLTLDEHSFYLKRQINHLTRSFAAPFGRANLRPRNAQYSALSAAGYSGVACGVFCTAQSGGAAAGYFADLRVNRLAGFGRLATTDG